MDPGLLAPITNAGSLAGEWNGIPVHLVGGHDTASAVAGIPLTHRAVAASFTVVSGHDQIEQISGGREHTVVLLMGVGTLAHSAHVLASGARGASAGVDARWRSSRTASARTSA